MEGYSNAWRQIVKPARNQYDEEYDLESEIESEGFIFEKKDYEFLRKDIKTFPY
jgi:hypothetical protein